MGNDLFDKNIKKGVKLKNYSTFHIGGKAEQLYIATDTNELTDFLLKLYASESLNAKKTKITVLGRGSNVLISSKGVKGLTIILRTANISLSENICIADAGVSFPSLASFMAENSLSGLEWASGIPGSVGGSCVMNAGAFEKSMQDVIEFVDIFRNGEVIRLTNEECGFSYRSSGFLNSDIVLRCSIRLSHSDKQTILDKTLKNREFRNRTQPHGFCIGSIFKAADKAAGWYIDKAGLKGQEVGGAYVYTKHANFIINSGFATSENVAALIDAIKAEVFIKFNVKLIEEIKYIGDF